jgi:hypothetical protein
MTPFDIFWVLIFLRVLLGEEEILSTVIIGRHGHRHPYEDPDPVKQ